MRAGSNASNGMLNQNRPYSAHDNIGGGSASGDSSSDGGAAESSDEEKKERKDSVPQQLEKGVFRCPWYARAGTAARRSLPLLVRRSLPLCHARDRCAMCVRLTVATPTPSAS